LRSAELRRIRASAVTSAAAVWFACSGSDFACAQVSPQPAEAGGTINLGGRGWSGPDGKPPTSDRAPNQLEFDFRGGFATDYIYRGTALSDHKPAVGAAIEATFAQLYAGVDGRQCQVADPAVR
jgi:hypothetical protein